MPLSGEECRRLIDAAHARAAQIGIRVTVAVVDEGGLLLALARMDHAPDTGEPRGGLRRRNPRQIRVAHHGLPIEAYETPGCDDKAWLWPGRGGCRTRGVKRLPLPLRHRRGEMLHGGPHAAGPMRYAGEAEPHLHSGERPAE